MTAVLFLHGSNDLYGASRVLLDDVGILTGLGASVRVILPYPGPLSALLAGVGAEVFERPLSVLRRVRPASALHSPLRLPVRASSDEVVVLWTLAVLPYLPVLRARRMRTVVSVHELLPGARGSMLARWANASGAIVMVNSMATKRWMAANGGDPARIRLAYPSAGRHRPLPRRPPDGAFRLLVAGRVAQRKGHLQAVEAVGIVRRRGVEAQLTLAGAPFPGEERHRSRLTAALNGATWARYIGEIEDIREALGDHDALLMASQSPESFGLVATEAWGAGRRVIAPDEGGAAEAVRMVDGVLFRPRSLPSMATALEFVAREAGLRQGPSADAPVAHLCTRARRRQVWEETL